MRILTITMSVGLLSSSLSADSPEIGPTPSFANDVQPILTKLGCNQGVCHGAQYGKGGFKLSLRAFDDPADHFEIVKSMKGRRVVPLEPTRSLLLAKPTMDVPHQGGRRLKKDSADYKTLSAWIGGGAPGPLAMEPALLQLTVEPAGKKSSIGETVQLRALATYRDGRKEDVTNRATFTSSSPAAAAVDDAGQTKIIGAGEAVVMVRFLDRVGVCRLITPYATPSAVPLLDADFKPQNAVDRGLVEKWVELGLRPSPAVGDAEFLRRVTFDVIGVSPTAEEYAQFINDSKADKRERLVDSLLERPEYIDFWTNKWGDLLRINRSLLQEKGMWAFHGFTREAVASNRPLDEFVASLLTASGSPFQKGAANFYRVGRQPEDWAENTAQVFLGVRMQCARCHHHPFENLSQADYYGMTAFFARVAGKPSEEYGIQGQDTVIYVRDVGEARHPRTGKILPPKPLGEEPLAETAIDPVDRRRSLARWLQDRQNPALARNIVNRYWGYFFGRGLVHPIDDIRVTNPASAPAVLEELARDFMDHGYDAKWLIRRLTHSRAYQASSQAQPGNQIDAENKYFTRYTVKRLSAEQLLDAIDRACGTREKFANLPEEFRAGSLPDTTVGSKFLDTFGRPRREIACECERVDSPNMSQALQLLTGRLLNAKVQSPTGRVAVLVKRKTPNPDAVTTLYLATFCRPPTADERTTACELVETAKSSKEGLEDLLWALLNSREFQFNH